MVAVAVICQFCSSHDVIVREAFSKKNPGLPQLGDILRLASFVAGLRSDEDRGPVIPTRVKHIRVGDLNKGSLDLLLKGGQLLLEYLLLPFFFFFFFFSFSFSFPFSPFPCPSFFTLL